MACGPRSVVHGRGRLERRRPGVLRIHRAAHRDRSVKVSGHGGGARRPHRGRAPPRVRARPEDPARVRGGRDLSRRWWRQRGGWRRVSIDCAADGAVAGHAGDAQDEEAAQEPHCQHAPPPGALHADHRGSGESMARGPERLSRAGGGRARARVRGAAVWGRPAWGVAGAREARGHEGFSRHRGRADGAREPCGRQGLLEADGGRPLHLRARGRRADGEGPAARGPRGRDAGLAALGGAALCGRGHPRISSSASLRCASQAWRRGCGAGPR
mmetsp:Transcript_5682/g.15924  ORF Transcript_5682/g.15924 Transcript_5682/m.15924 type:complete len:271 (-) Transcript_5682:3169-3981(-)